MKPSHKDLMDKAFIYVLAGEDLFESDEEKIACAIYMLKNPYDYVRFALCIIDNRVYDLEKSQMIIIDSFMSLIRGEFPVKNLIINCPPSIGKTSITVWGMMSYLYSLDASVKNLHISRSDDLVRDNSNKIKMILTNQAHNDIFGVEISGNTASKGLWETTDLGAMKASSSGGQITGFRAGRIGKDITGIMLIDDPQKPSDMYSIPTLNSINSQWENTFQSRRASVVDTPTILIMQRLGNNDFTNHLLDGDEQWMHLVIPSYVDEDYSYSGKGIYIPHNLPVGSVFPKRWDNETAHRLMSDIQYSQETRPEDGDVFSRDWFEIVDTLPTIKECHIKVDTATKVNRYNDYSVFSMFEKGIDNKAYHSMLVKEKIKVPYLYDRLIMFIRQALETTKNKRRFIAKIHDKEFKVHGSNSCIIKVVIEDKDSGQGLIQTIEDNIQHEEGLQDVLFVGMKRSESKYARALRASEKIEKGGYKILKDIKLFSTSDEKLNLDRMNISPSSMIINEFTEFKADDSHRNDDVIDTVFDMMNYETVVCIGGVKLINTTL